MSDWETQLTNELKPTLRKTLAVGGAALLLCFIGAFVDRQQFFPSYLTAYMFWLGVPVGCLGLLMIHHLVGGTWGFVIQRALESAIRTFPVLALLFVPLLFGLPDLFAWARPEVVAHDPILQQKAAYLNVPGFVVRAVVYFTVWIVLGFLLTRWSEEQDRTAQSAPTQRLQTLSGPGLVLYGLTVTFSAIDWLMSLEPRWYSTIFGMIFMVSYGLAALAFVIIVSYFLSDREPLASIFAPWVRNDLGNLLLAFVMLWAYMSFSQFLLVWVENLQHEIPWYLHRTNGGWGVIAVALIALQFALPFLLLLSRAVKRKSAALCMIAAGIALMHQVELFWFVAPTFHPDGVSIHWTTILAPLGIGGVWLAAFLFELQKRPLLPQRDPRFIAIIEEQGLAHHG
ncbi:MAG: hypothetical protein ACM3SP_18530 [Chloroflexota bacterium]